MTKENRSSKAVILIHNPERSEGFQSGLGGQKCVHSVSVTLWPLRQPKIFPLPLIESIRKKYYAPETTNVGLDPTLRNVWCVDDGRTKIRPEKCLTRTKTTSTGPIRLGTVGMR